MVEIKFRNKVLDIATDDSNLTRICKHPDKFHCPNVPLILIEIHDLVGNHTVLEWCPKCNNVYSPNLDIEFDDGSKSQPVTMHDFI